jgi:PilZ domain/GYF domain 2
MKVGTEDKSQGYDPEHDVSEWFVLKGENRFGPFVYSDMIRMLQEKVIFGFDFAWHGGLSGWKRLADIADFQESAIRTLAKDPKTRKAVFSQRKHQRHNHKGELIIHDQQNWWRGEASEISSGGVGVMMDNALLVPGQQVNLHFKPFEKFPTFNALGEVVSKKYVETVNNGTATLRYGVRFVSISGTGKEQLLKLLQDDAA